IDPSSVSIVSQPAHGTVQVNSTGVVTYTPTSGFLGLDVFTYTIANTNGERSNVAKVRVTVTPCPPDTYTTIPIHIIIYEASGVTQDEAFQYVNDANSIYQRVFDGHITLIPEFGPIQVLPGGNFTTPDQESAAMQAHNSGRGITITFVPRLPSGRLGVTP